MTNGQLTCDSSETDLSHLIGLIYDAVPDRSRWPLFLEALVQATQCSRATLTLSGAPEWTVACFHGWTDEEIGLWVERYSAADAWRIATANVPLGEVWTSLELCPQELFEQCIAYREF